MAKYQPTIGLEIHIELNTQSKMFCSCPNDPDERNPNVNICPICLGHPGTLPVINKEAVKKVIKTGLALSCQIPEYSRFDRKNYFYPDLPKGYQISQLYQPLCRNGFLEIAETSSHLSLRSASPSSDIDRKKIRIREVHLEEDTGSLIHPLKQQRRGEKRIYLLRSPGADYSLVNFNRAGVPLMELATEPDMKSSKEARKFAEEFHLIMHYLDVSDADMEKGQMRVEVNISLAQKTKGKAQKLGTKVEIKNLNSFRAVEQAIEYEIKRQTEILDKGEKIIQETRGWLDIKGSTVSQREKEAVQDYRYFPEPDLPPLHIVQDMVAEAPPHLPERSEGREMNGVQRTPPRPTSWSLAINEIKAEIPELPQKRKERLVREYSLDEKSAEIFVYNKNLGEYFEKVISELPPNLARENLFKLIKIASNYIITDLQGLLKGTSVTDKDFRITPENFAEFITLIYEGKISSKIAKMVLEEMFKTGADPSHIIEEKGLIQISDEVEIEKIIKEVILKNPKAVEDFKKGKANAFQYLIGQVMAKTKGKADPQITGALLKDILDKDI